MLTLEVARRLDAQQGMCGETTFDIYLTPACAGATFLPMSEFRTIEIDFDIHKKIEMERQGFTESANEVLRRLLKIGGQSSRPFIVSNGRSWSGKGVSLPHGTKLRMKYNGCEYSGLIEDGEWLVDGKRFSSPSAAASVVSR